MPRQDLQGMVAHKHQESLSPVLIKTQAMTQIQYHNCSQNGTHRIRQYLDGRIRQHGCATPNRTHRYDDESHNRNRPLISIHIHPLICPSHNDKETSKESARGNMDSRNFDIKPRHHDSYQEQNRSPKEVILQILKTAQGQERPQEKFLQKPVASQELLRLVHSQNYLCHILHHIFPTIQQRHHTFPSTYIIINV